MYLRVVLCAQFFLIRIQWSNSSTKEYVSSESGRSFRPNFSLVSNTIPLNPFSKAVLKKYKGKLGNRCLPVISEQNTNDYLEEVFVDVKLNRMVQKINFQGAKAIKATAPLSEVVTFHISKKTFITNFLAKGGSLLTAMAITGNKDLNTARRYYKMVDTLKAYEMARVFGK